MQYVSLVMVADHALCIVWRMNHAFVSKANLCC